MSRDTPPTASFGRTMKTVLWSFFGVRKASDHARDAARLNPVHIVLAALLATGLFVLILIVIVTSIVR